MRHGEFSGEPLTRWLSEEVVDRRMIILEDFWFRDPRRRWWDVPAKAVVNGGSIPRSLWTLVGAPYTGNYRLASIVHDFACAKAGHDIGERRAADRMYYHACRAGGCSIWEANIQYLAVRIGAIWPGTEAWQVDALAGACTTRLTRHGAELRLEADFQRIAEIVLSKGETDDPLEIEARTETAFALVVRKKRAVTRLDLAHLFEGRIDLADRRQELLLSQRITPQ